MSKFLHPFFRGIQGIPYGERVMPNYIFADRERRGTTTIMCRLIRRGNKWWCERTTTITTTGSPDEVHVQWIGGYDSEEECQDRINKELGK